MRALVFIICLLSAQGTLAQTFDHHIEVRIDNTGGGAITDYQFKIVVDTKALIDDGLMQSDCGDIRFEMTLGSGSYGDISYWIAGGCGTNATEIWVNVPFVAATSDISVFLRHHCTSTSNLPSASDKLSTIPLFDDFSSSSGTSVDPDEYKFINAGSSVENGEFKTSNSNAGDNDLQSKPLPAPPFEFSFCFDDEVTGLLQNTWAGYSDGTSLVVMGIPSGSDGRFGIYTGSGYEYFGTRPIDGSGGSHCGSIRVTDTQVEFIFDGQSRYTMANPGITPAYATVYAANAYVHFDNLKITTFTPTPPVVAPMNSTLPLEIVSFAARHTAAGVQLTWATETENDAHIFKIQRSDESLNFETIGMLPAKGHHVGTTSYSFTDNRYLAGRNYYRVAQIDFSGEASLTSLVMIDAGDTPFRFSIYPNPVRAVDGYARIELNETAELKIMDIGGNSKLQQTFFPGVHEVALTSLPPGVYWIQVSGYFGSREFRLVVTP